MGKGSFFFRVAVAIGLLVAASACGRTGTSSLNPREFQDRVVAEVTRAYPDARVQRLGDHRLSVGFPGKTETTTELDRAYAIYQDAPAALDGVVRDLVTAVGPHEEPTSKDLVLLVRPGGFQFKSQVGSALAKPLVGDLAVYVGVDLGDSVAITPASELQRDMKLDDAGLWAAALTNTRARLKIARHPPKLGRAAEISNVDGFASSLLAIDDFWDSPELTAAGPVVVAPWGRDSLLVAALRDRPAVDSLRKQMADVRDDPETLSNALIVRRNGRWEVLR